MNKQKLAGIFSSRLTPIVGLLLLVIGILLIAAVAPHSASALRDWPNTPPDADCQPASPPTNGGGNASPLEQYYDCEYKNTNGNEVTGECTITTPARSATISDVSCSPAFGSPTGSSDGGGDNGGDDNGGGGGSGNETNEVPEPECEGGGFGWFICPLIEAMQHFTSYTFDQIIEPLAQTSPLSLDANSDTFRVWVNVRNIANIVFVIIFLIIIFSQATSLGLSNYGIKRMLPRLIIAAILMNVSYYISALAVDLSNIAGSGIRDIFFSVLETDPQESGGGSSVAGAIATVGLSIGAIFLLVAGLGTVTIAFIVVFLVLAFREAILVLLALLSPLAFAAWLLPNTEKYFKKWWELFLQLLVIYPALMAIFAGATVAANVLATSGQFLQQITALIIQAAPLFALPALVKGTSGVLGRIDNLTRRYSEPAANKAGEFVKSSAKRGVQQAGARMANNDLVDSKSRGRKAVGKAARFVGGYKTRRDFKLQSKEQNAQRAQQESLGNLLEKDEEFAKRAAGKAGGETGVARAQARGIEATDKLIGEEQKAATTVIENAGLTNEERTELAKTGAVKRNGETLLHGEMYQKAAIGMLASQGQVGKLDEVIRSSGGMSAGVKKTLAYHLQQNYSTLKQKGHNLNDDSLKTILNSDGVVDEAALRGSTARMPDLNSTQFASQDAASLKHLEAAMTDGTLNSTQITNAQAIAAKTLADPQVLQSLTPQTKEIMQRIATVVQGGGGPTPVAPSGGGTLGSAPQPATQTMPSGATVTIPTPQLYTKAYSHADLQALGSGGVRTMVGGVGGAQNLSDADVAKIINAAQGQPAMQDINDEMVSERNRRRGSGAPPPGPGSAPGPGPGPGQPPPQQP